MAQVTAPFLDSTQPAVRRSAAMRLLSGQNPTLGGKADTAALDRRVASIKPTIVGPHGLFDHLLGAHQYRGRRGETECFGGLGTRCEAERPSCSTASQIVPARLIQRD